MKDDSQQNAPQSNVESAAGRELRNASVLDAYAASMERGPWPAVDSDFAPFLRRVADGLRALDMAFGNMSALHGLTRAEKAAKCVKMLAALNAPAELPAPAGVSEEPVGPAVVTMVVTEADLRMLTAATTLLFHTKEGERQIAVNTGAAMSKFADRIRKAYSAYPHPEEPGAWAVVGRDGMMLNADVDKHEMDMAATYHTLAGGTVQPLYLHPSPAAPLAQPTEERPTT